MHANYLFFLFSHLLTVRPLNRNSLNNQVVF